MISDLLTYWWKVSIWRKYTLCNNWCILVCIIEVICGIICLSVAKSFIISNNISIVFFCENYVIINNIISLSKSKKEFYLLTTYILYCFCRYWICVCYFIDVYQLALVLFIVISYIDTIYMYFQSTLTSIIAFCRLLNICVNCIWRLLSVMAMVIVHYILQFIWCCCLWFSNSLKIYLSIPLLKLSFYNIIRVTKQYLNDSSDIISMQIHQILCMDCCINWFYFKVYYDYLYHACCLFIDKLFNIARKILLCYFLQIVIVLILYSQVLYHYYNKTMQLFMCWMIVVIVCVRKKYPGIHIIWTWISCIVSGMWYSLAFIVKRICCSSSM